MGTKKIPISNAHLMDVVTENGYNNKKCHVSWQFRICSYKKYFLNYGSIENYIKSLLLSDGSTFNRTLTLKCHNETKIIFQTVSEKVSGFERKQNVIEVTQLDSSNHNHYDNHKQLALIAINTVLKKHFAEAK